MNRSEMTPEQRRRDNRKRAERRKRRIRRFFPERVIHRSNGRDPLVLIDPDGEQVELVPGPDNPRGDILLYSDLKRPNGKPMMLVIGLTEYARRKGWRLP